MRILNVIYNCDACKTSIDPEDGFTLYLAFADDMRRKTGNSAPIARFSVHPWREDLAASSDAKHFCCTTCLIDALRGWAVNLTAPDAPAAPDVAEIEKPVAAA